jgi:hypothetical protein
VIAKAGDDVRIFGKVTVRWRPMWHVAIFEAI